MANTNIPVWKPRSRREHELATLIEQGEPVTDVRLIPSLLNLVQRELVRAEQQLKDIGRELAGLDAYFGVDGTPSIDYRLPKAAFRSQARLRMYADQILSHQRFLLEMAADAINLLAYLDEDSPQPAGDISLHPTDREAVSEPDATPGVTASAHLGADSPTPEPPAAVGETASLWTVV